MKKPAISLIMINYNRAAYLVEAVNSVIRQTCPDWELIIVDDASSDDSVTIVKSYLSNPKIRFFQNNRHLGIGLSRVRAVAETNAEIVGIIDSDDALAENAAEEMIKAHENNPQALIYSQLMVCDAELKPLHLGTNGPIGAGESNLTKQCISHFFTFKKSAYQAVGGYAPFLSPAEDKDLFYKLEEEGDTLFIDQILYYYRLNPRSASNYGWGKIRARLFYMLGKYRAYARRRKNDSAKKIRFLELIPQRPLKNKAKLILDKFYFPFLANFALKKLKELSQAAQSNQDLWAISDSFRCGPKIAGLNLNIKSAQVAEEIIRLMETVRTSQSRIIMEIGTATGGTLFFWTKIAPPDATIISLDLPFGRFGGGYLSTRRRLFNSLPQPDQNLHLLQADSHNPATKEQIMEILRGRKIDFLFIDGDHSYSGAKLDFENYKDLVKPGGLIALHDIAANKTDSASQVDRLWSEIKANYQTEEYIADKNQGWAGIGLIRL
jgi:glycosyltransferase involved in cell wall biosynthesis